MIRIAPVVRVSHICLAPPPSEISCYYYYCSLRVEIFLTMCMRVTNFELSIVIERMRIGWCEVSRLLEYRTSTENIIDICAQLFELRCICT